MPKVTEAVVAGLLLVSVLGGCHTMSGRVARTTPDTATAERVKAAIAAVPGGTGVNVATKDNTIYLSGSPKDPETQIRVISAAQNAAPDHRIVSYLSGSH